MTDKSKGGRPPAPPGLRRVNVPLRLPEWLVQWMAEQPETPAELIEAALLKAHKLRPPRAPSLSWLVAQIGRPAAVRPTATGRRSGAARSAVAVIDDQRTFACFDLTHFASFIAASIASSSV